MVDFDQLKQELSDHTVEGIQERYHLNWPGKLQSISIANRSITKSLRPCQNQSVNFDTTRNLIIEGENLDALKLLQESYLGRIKLIYIDPPYNTGSDLIYDDDYCEDMNTYLLRSNQKSYAEEKFFANPETNGRFHSVWLSMIYPRLRIARNLLAIDGAIFIHIDENEYSNLEIMMSEIFGRKNNLGTIVWDKRNPKGDASKVAQQHEYIVAFARDYSSFKESVDFRLPKINAENMMRKALSFTQAHGGVNKKSRNEYRKWLSKQNFSGGEKGYSLIDDEGNVYQSVSMAWPNKKKAPTEYYIPLIHPVTKRACPVPEKGWRNPPNTMKELVNSEEIIFGSDETTQPRRKYLLKKHIRENVSSLIYFGGSDDSLLKDLGVDFDNPKPVQIISRLVQSVCSCEDIVLDFFAGSGSCAHSVLELNALEGLNLQYILVQAPEKISSDRGTLKNGLTTIADICRTRVRNASQKVINRSRSSKWNQDIGFRALRVDTSNMKNVFYLPDSLRQKDLLDAVDNIKEDRNAEDLLFQVLIDWGIDLALPIRQEGLHGKTIFFVDENALVACFEKEIGEDLVKDLAQRNPAPLRVVFRDNGFVSDAVKINVEQIFRQLSPTTEVRTI